MYIAPGLGQTVHREQNFYVNRKALSLYPFVASFKEISLKSDFRPFFNDLIHVYSPGQGQTALRGQILMSAERPYHFTHLSQLSKKSL